MKNDKCAYFYMSYVFVPTFTLISSYFKFAFCFEMFPAFKGIEGAYPDPGAKVEAIELLGISGGSVLICSS